jgi:hypothetical protein
MESKSNMQVGYIKLLHYHHYYPFFFKNHLMEHNTCYISMYLAAQQDYIVQVEEELSSNVTILEQMQNVAI